MSGFDCATVTQSRRSTEASKNASRPIRLEVPDGYTLIATTSATNPVASSTWVRGDHAVHGVAAGSTPASAWATASICPLATWRFAAIGPVHPPGRTPQVPDEPCDLELMLEERVHRGRVGPVKYASVARAAVGTRPGIPVRPTSEPDRRDFFGAFFSPPTKRSDHRARPDHSVFACRLRVRRKKRPHGGVSKRLIPSKVSAAARPVPQNRSSHPHSPPCR